MSGFWGVVCRSSATWISNVKHILSKKPLQPSVVPQAQVTAGCVLGRWALLRCWYSAHQVATGLISFFKTVFRKGQAWLTSQSQLCQEAARLCGFTQVRCVDVKTSSYHHTWTPRHHQSSLGAPL